MAEECAICTYEYQVEGNRCPKLLRCSHTVCLDCLRQLVQRSSNHRIDCPICRADITVPAGGASEFPTNRYIVEALERNRFNNDVNRVIEGDAGRINENNDAIGEVQPGVNAWVDPENGLRSAGNEPGNPVQHGSNRVHPMNGENAVNSSACSKIAFCLNDIVLIVAIVCTSIIMVPTLMAVFVIYFLCGIVYRFCLAFMVCNLATCNVNEYCKKCTEGIGQHYTICKTQIDNFLTICITGIQHCCANRYQTCGNVLENLHPFVLYLILGLIFVVGIPVLICVAILVTAFSCIFLLPVHIIKRCKQFA